MGQESGKRCGIGRIGAPRRWACVAGLGALAVSTSASADWSDDFDGGFGAAWSIAASDDEGEPPTTGVTTFAVVEAGADDHLRVAHSTQALRGGGGGAADVFAWVDESFTDLVLAADVNADPSAGQQSVLGLLARGNPEAGSAYFAGIDFASSRFLIARSLDFIDPLTPIASDDGVAIDPGETYRVEFSLIGSTLSARLRDASSGSLLSTISTVDPNLGSGLAGLLVETGYDAGQNPLAPVVGTFDSVVVVPEPGWQALAASGGAALAGLARRRRILPG